MRNEGLKELFLEMQSNQVERIWHLTPWVDTRCGTRITLWEIIINFCLKFGIMQKKSKKVKQNDVPAVPIRWGSSIIKKIRVLIYRSR